MSTTWPITKRSKYHRLRLKRALAGLLIVFALCWVPFHADAGPSIYQWKDEQGIWHFSDTPGSDAPAEIIEQEPPGRTSDSPKDSAEPPADAVSGQQGILWSIKHRGVAPNYVLGTIHSGDDRVMAFPQPVREALQNSQSFTMEMIPDAAALMKLSAAMMLQDGQNLRTLLGDT